MKYTIWICLLLVCSVGQAQNVKTLQECVRIAWENNISVKQTAIGIAQSEINLKQARSSRLPNLNAGASLNLSGRSVDPTTNVLIPNNFYSNNYNINSNVLLYNGGSVLKNIERSKLSIESAELQTDDIKQNIALQVANAYLNVLFAEENAGISLKRKKITLQQLDQLTRLINAGLRPKNDILDLEATLAANEQDIISAEGTANLVRLQLNQIMRIPIDEIFTLEIPDVIIANLDDPFTLNSGNIYDESANRQPALKNSELSIRIAEIDQSISRASYKPTLGFGGSLGTNYASSAKTVTGGETVFVPTTIVFNGSEQVVGLPSFSPTIENIPFGEQIGENITYGFGLSLSVPIYNNYRNKSSVLLSDLAKENAVLVDQQTRDQFRQQLEQALIDARNAKKSYEAAEKSVLASERSLDNLKVRFEQGAVNNFELNIATDQYDTAVTQSLISKYDYVFKMKVLDFYRGKGLDF